MKSWRMVSMLLLSLVLVSSAACNPFGGDKEETSQQLAEVMRGDLTVSISGSGNIQPTNEARLTFGTDGRVDKIYIEEGDTVTEGKILARLNTDTLELALTQAQVALATQQVAITQAQVAVTQAQVALATQQVAVTQAQAALNTQQVAVTQAQVAVTQAQVALTTQQVAVTQAQVALTTQQVAVTQAQAALQTAEYNLEEAQEPYTEQDITNAEAALVEAEYTLEFAQWALERATLLRDKRNAQEAVYRAQLNLGIAQQNLDTILSGTDEDEIAILETQIEVAKQSLELAQESLELAQESLELTQESLEPAQESLEVAEQSSELAQESLEVAEQSSEVAEQSLELTEESLEVAEQSLEQFQQSVELAQQQLDEATITAPFDGVIASVDADVNDTVSTMTTITHLIDLNTMKLEIEVDEIDIPDVKLGQRAIIEIDALPTLPLEGEVIFISSLGKGETGVVLYEVKISFDAPTGSGLRASMSAEADIIINERNNVWLVPSRSIKQDSQGNPVVKVMVSEETQERPVVIGISDGFDTEIVYGLNEGEIVVVTR